MRAFSPLRYPGGKQVLARVLARLIELNKCEGGVYAEPYAGGAGAALSLLFSEHVSHLLLNDADISIHAFWHALLNRTDQFLKMTRDTPLTLEEWQRQRAVYLRRRGPTSLRLGFATFYLNRCNRSGIIGNAGPIGGHSQSGEWGIDARFNRAGLTARVERIAAYRDRISLFNLDALDFLREQVATRAEASRAFVYLDPPYFGKGSQLYLNYYRDEDHKALAEYMRLPHDFQWAMSYDDAPEVRRLYRGFRRIPFNLGYSARDRRQGKEILIAMRSLVLPSGWKRRIPDRIISTADELPAI